MRNWRFIKQIIHFFLKKIGYELKKINNKINHINFDDLIKYNLNENCIIFDVGGNRGQSIERFKKIFKKPIIHSFEPIKSEFDYMFKKFKDNKNFILNCCALGDKIEEKELNITANTGNSSFNKINPSTNWLKKRSRQFNTTMEGYTTSIQRVKVDTLDQYCKNNNISKIDLLKIDTQGYEDKVLEGSVNTLKNNNIKIIVVEIMFDNVYDKYFSFSDIEKYIIPNNFRMVGIDLTNNNLFNGLVFFADVYYFNKKYFDLNISKAL